MGCRVRDKSTLDPAWGREHAKACCRGVCEGCKYHYAEIKDCARCGGVDTMSIRVSGGLKCWNCGAVVDGHDHPIELVAAWVQELNQQRDRRDAECAATT